MLELNLLAVGEQTSCSLTRICESGQALFGLSVSSVNLMIISHCLHLILSHASASSWGVSAWLVCVRVGDLRLVRWWARAWLLFAKWSPEEVLSVFFFLFLWRSNMGAVMRQPVWKASICVHYRWFAGFTDRLGSWGQGFGGLAQVSPSWSRLY